MMNVLMKALGMMMMEVMTILVVMMTVVTVDEDEDDDADDDKEIDPDFLRARSTKQSRAPPVAERYSQEPDGKEQPAPEAAGSRWRAWLRRSLRRSPPPMLRLTAVGSLWMKMGRCM